MMIEWQAVPLEINNRMTQHLIVKGNTLVQLSWGTVRMWSTKDYRLLGTVVMFNRAVTEVVVIKDMLICCGRDALSDNDNCGLNEGLKGWKFALGDENEGKNVQEWEGSGEHDAGGVFGIGTPVRAARGLSALSDGRLVVSVLRGTSWYVEMWEV